MVVAYSGSLAFTEIDDARILERWLSSEDLSKLTTIRRPNCVHDMTNVLRRYLVDRMKE